MEEEEEDKLLLSRLGVTSANQDDIESHILQKVENAEENSGTPPHADEHLVESSSSSSTWAKLSSKLRAINVEIGAVAASIDYEQKPEKCENNLLVGDNVTKESTEHPKDPDSVQVTTDGLTIQQALAAERLKSLKKTKAQLQDEIAKFYGGVTGADNRQCNELLGQLVKEEVKHKRKSKEVQHSSRSSKRKAVGYDEDADFDAMLDAASTGFVETERDKLVQKGVLTPFHSLKGFERRVQQSGPSNRVKPLEGESNETFASASIAKAAKSLSELAQSRPTTKLVGAEFLPKLDAPTRPFQRLKTLLKQHPDSLESDLEHKRQKPRKLKRPLPNKKWRKNVENEHVLQIQVDVDEETDAVASYDQAEQYGNDEDLNDSGQSCTVLEGGLKIPNVIFEKLFDFQRVGVQWLWELHCQKAGGIIGDEMGLGKTVQVLSFLGALHFSNMYKPSIVICPVTLLLQWQREAKKWYPKFHVEILHDSAPGSVKSAQAKDSESEYDSEDSLNDEHGRGLPAKSRKNWDNLIDNVLKSESGLLLTSYEQLRILGNKLLDIEWGYAILDEGHRIRNPNAEITLLCKQLQTVHRVIMTGSPIQNKLAELWSLFDFIFPGKLGVLPVFEMEFSVPISVGGYANATPLKVSTAYRCAVVLRDLVMPYLLRRMKANVSAQLSKKTEHVLFCSLTTNQRSLYRAFLASSEVEQIFYGNRNSLYGIDVMRKICNHPDLLEREHAAKHPDYGNPERSGKMEVIAQVLKLWNEQGHRVLVFTQTQQMLDILENFMNTKGYAYRRMDGLTAVKQRMALIDEFNNSSEVFVFILTTKVGGLGTNLTGANRVIIFDPDWNPSTDMQARERAWRIGQTRDVTVYRLITRGTVEEKVYHRQIYKQFLTNKILKNPQQRRFFKARDMRDLFTLQDDTTDNSTETSNIFSQLSGDLHIGVNGGSGEINESLHVASNGTSNHLEITNHQNPKVRTSSKGKTKVEENGGGLDEETSILKSLFDANGIHSAVNHDVIMNANDVSDKVRFEEQASLVAQRAAEALHQSRMIRSRDSFAVPTWTGKSGAAGAPSYIPRKFGSKVNTKLIGNSKTSEVSACKSPVFPVGASTGRALSSAELLAKARGNQVKAVCDGLEDQFAASSSSSHATTSSSRSKPPSKNMIIQPEVLIHQLCAFIEQRGGSADSGSIVQHFRDKIPTKDLPLFRNLLKEIAVLEKDAGGDGSQWVLKHEYRE